MTTNSAPLLADLFLHAYEADFLQWILKNKDFFLAQTFNSSFRSIEDILSLNNYLHRISPNDLEVKDITDTQKSTSCLVLHLDNGGILKTKHYVKRDDYTFPIVNFPFISSNIPTSPANGVYISQLVCCARACAQYNDFLDRAQLLTQRDTLLTCCFVTDATLMQ